MKNIVCFILLLSVFFSAGVYAGKVNVAVASNFKYTLEKLTADYKKRTGHEVIISSASSGKLFAQIVHGAPYDVFLSADEKLVNLLIEKGRANEKNAEVYALGKLVLLSNITQINDCKNVLYSEKLKYLAIANQDIAPYGRAAEQVLRKLDLWQKLKSHLVTGENIAQTMLFVLTGNAEVGFVADSMLRMRGQVPSKVCVWNIPAEMYSPIKQKMVLLDKAAGNRVASDFIRYMRSLPAKMIIQSTGYDVL